jgi:hypothetical protein
LIDGDERGASTLREHLVELRLGRGSVDDFDAIAKQRQLRGQASNEGRVGAGADDDDERRRRSGARARS